MKREEEQARNSYNTMAKFYHEYRTTKFKGGWFFNEYLEMPEMLKLLGNVKNKSILDWGCGSGIYAKILAKKGAKVKGFDISKEMLSIAKKDNPKLDLRLGSGYKIPFKEKFDIVYSSLAMHYVKDWDKALSQVSKVLKKNGLFLFSGGNPIIDSTVTTYDNNKLKTIGTKNYFDEKMDYADWTLPNKKTVRIRVYPKTYETVIKTIIKNGFEIMDYVDAKPLPSSKKKFPEQYKLWSKVPKFCIWKLKKK